MMRMFGIAQHLQSYPQIDYLPATSEVTILRLFVYSHPLSDYNYLKINPKPLKAFC